MAPAARDEAEIDEQLDQVVRDLPFDAIKAGKFTRRVLIDAHHPGWKKNNPRITRTLVEQVFARALVSGGVVERDGRNGSGEKNHLFGSVGRVLGG